MPRGLKPKAKEEVVEVATPSKATKKENLAILQSTTKEGTMTVKGQTFEIKDYEVEVPLEMKDVVAEHIRMGG